MLSNVFDPVPQKQFLNPPTVWGLRWCNLKKTNDQKHNIRMNVPIVFPIFSNYHGFEHPNTYGLQMLIANYQYIYIYTY